MDRIWYAVPNQTSGELSLDMRRNWHKDVSFKRKCGKFSNNYHHPWLAAAVHTNVIITSLFRFQLLLLIDRRTRAREQTLVFLSKTLWSHHFTITFTHSRIVNFTHLSHTHKLNSGALIPAGLFEYENGLNCIFLSQKGGGKGVGRRLPGWESSNNYVGGGGEGGHRLLGQTGRESSPHTQHRQAFVQTSRNVGRITQRGGQIPHWQPKEKTVKFFLQIRTEDISYICSIKALKSWIVIMLHIFPSKGLYTNFLATFF